MSWAKIDDGFLDHPKVLRAGEDAAALYLRALIWCARHLTDGAIPREALRAITTKRDAGKLAGMLVAVNLWESTPAGWQVHDYAKHNPSRAQVEADRSELSAKRAAAGRIGGMRSGLSRGGGEAPMKHTRSKPEATREAFASRNEASCFGVSKAHPVPSLIDTSEALPATSTGRSDAQRELMARALRGESE